ncbi:hypothetical protein GGI00_000249 [Coemansia sp. RSA 2681]|nr:hypothetical protein GGI00_000249 [Coemansia sp. RSA 2681]
MGNVCFDTNQCVFYELESGYSSGQSDSEDAYSSASEAPSLSASQACTDALQAHLPHLILLTFGKSLEPEDAVAYIEEIAPGVKVDADTVLYWYERFEQGNFDLGF